MSSTYNEIQLLGVPHYLQGEADGLCVYYAMSMVLVALYPEFHGKIHEAPHYKREGSPVFQILRQRARSDRKFKEEVGVWFFNGMRTTGATRILNKLFREYYTDCRATTYFIHQRVKCRRMRKRKYNRQLRALERIWNVSDICNAISLHLPVIISGGGIENHAVVAVGWGSEGRSRWITYHDPGLVRASWDYVRKIFYDDCVAIIPNWECFTEHRPPALITRGKHTENEAWNPEELGHSK